MLGSVVGDIIGSVYEWYNVKSEDFDFFNRESRFTDDTVMTVAVADAILNINKGQEKQSHQKLYAYKFREYGKRYPDAGYGQMFKDWLSYDSISKQKSYGNGAAMRVSPIGLAFNSLNKVLSEAKNSVAFTHNHSEATKGAQAIACSVFLAKNNFEKLYIKDYVERMFKYNLNQQLEDIRPNYKFDSSCKGSVPQAIIAFLESQNFEDCIKKAISIGGDSDTIACMAGGIAHAYYKEIPKTILDRVNLILDYGLKQKIKEFKDVFSITW